ACDSVLWSWYGEARSIWACACRGLSVSLLRYIGEGRLECADDGLAWGEAAGRERDGVIRLHPPGDGRDGRRHSIGVKHDAPAPTRWPGRAHGRMVGEGRERLDQRHVEQRGAAAGKHDADG